MNNFVVNFLQNIARWSDDKLRTHVNLYLLVLNNILALSAALNMKVEVQNCCFLNVKVYQPLLLLFPSKMKGIYVIVIM